VGAGDIPAYHASKGAVRLMTKNDAILYAPDKIRVNSVHPGFIWTSMAEKIARDRGQNVAAARQQLAEKHPLGEIGEPEDVAWGIVYLASAESKFVTGSELVIDGGYTAQ
jgi:NAD(P)-dependent dehydrogenase (short-subunit alcohol dehydrogenase family)